VAAPTSCSSPQALTELACHDERDDALREAHAILERHHVRTPRIRGTLFARMAGIAGNVDEASKLADRAVELLRRLPPDREVVDAPTIAAYMKLNREDLREAERTFLNAAHAVLDGHVTRPLATLRAALDSSLTSA